MTATVTLSIEVELAWGMHDTKGRDPATTISPQRVAETDALDALLETCEATGTPITFDIVGHLLETSCDGTHDGPHEPGWFGADPGTDSDRDPWYYAPDLISAIAESNVAHELATHTYSHVLCAETTPEVLDWELKQARTLHEAFDIPQPMSLVTPRHQQPDPTVLRANDIEVLRTPLEAYNRPSSRFRTLVWSLRRSHPVGTPTWVDGVLQTLCTPHPSLTTHILQNGQRPPHPVFRAIPRRIRQRIHERYLVGAVDTAIEADGHVHLWTHLFNLANGAQMVPIRRFLTKLQRRVDDGNVKVVTMSDLPDHA